MEKSAGLCFSMAPLFLVLGVLLPGALASHDYGQALTKSILFFEAQRSGYLPGNQRVQWRGNSGLNDGKISGVMILLPVLFPYIKLKSVCISDLIVVVVLAIVQLDLVGGYYDAGDNVKFGLPMAFTVTMMSWSILEYGKQMGASGELGHAIDAVKWGTDYLIKAHPEPNVLYGEVKPTLLHRHTHKHTHSLFYCIYMTTALAFTSLEL